MWRKEKRWIKGRGGMNWDLIMKMITDEWVGDAREIFSDGDGMTGGKGGCCMIGR